MMSMSIASEVRLNGTSFSPGDAVNVNESNFFVPFSTTWIVTPVTNVEPFKLSNSI